LLYQRVSAFKRSAVHGEIGDAGKKDYPQIHEFSLQGFCSNVSSSLTKNRLPIAS